MLIWYQYSYKLWTLLPSKNVIIWHKDHSVHAPSQWETMLHCSYIVTSALIGWAHTQNDPFWQNWELNTPTTTLLPHNVRRLSIPQNNDIIKLISLLVRLGRNRFKWNNPQRYLLIRVKPNPDMKVGTKGIAWNYTNDIKISSIKVRFFPDFRYFASGKIPEIR